MAAKKWMAGILVLLCLILLAYYSPFLFGGRQYFVSDNTFFFEPFTRLIQTGWNAGAMPLWNPYIYCGSPQLANPSPGIFYFPNLFFACFTYSKALALVQLFHQLIAFIAGYLLASVLLFSSASCCVVGLIIALCGYFFALPSNYTLPGTFCWGVLALYALCKISLEKEKTAGNRRSYLTYVVLASYSVHWMLMAGRPEIYVPFFLMFGCLILLLVLRWVSLEQPSSNTVVQTEIPDAAVAQNQTWRHRLPTAFYQCFAIILGILLSAPMLLPVYEWSKLSPRAGGLGLKQVFYWSCNWYDYLGLVLSYPLGDLQQPLSRFGSFVASRPAYYPFLSSAFMGPVALTLVFYGLADKTFSQRYYTFSAALVAALVAMGKYGPLSPLLLKVAPFLAILRYPVKLLIFVVFFLALLAGRGLHFIAAGKESKVAAIVTNALWGLATTAGALMWAFAHFWHKLSPFYPVAFFQTLGRPLFFTSLIGLGFSILIVLRKRIKVDDKQTISFIVLAALIGAMVVPAFQARQKNVPDDYYGEKSFLVDKLHKFEDEEGSRKQDRKKNSSRILPPRLLLLYFDPIKVPAQYPNVATVNGERYMRYCREMLLPNTNIDKRWPITYGYESAETKDYRVTFLDTLHCSHIDVKEATDEELARFCKITSTVYVASQIVGVDKKGLTRELNPIWFKKIDEDNNSNLRLYSVNQTLPRAYIASGWIKCDQKTVINRIMHGPDLPGSVTMIEPGEVLKPASDDVDGRALTIDSGIAPGEAKLPSFSQFNADNVEQVSKSDTVSLLQDQNEHVALSVSCDRDSLVVLNDRFYPGWKATIDSVPATIYRANGFMRAVYVSKGKHLIEFNYRPDSLQMGFYLAAAALFTTVIMMLIMLVKRTKTAV